MNRVIFLVDMNAFFISCEMSRNPSLKGKPAAVAGDPERRSGIILAANYDARKYGVKTTMVIHEAKKLCPDIILVPPDHEFYRKKSKEVMKILSRYTPVIQQNSIDEAWLDLTGCEALFGKPKEIAEKIMDDIMRELDLWCSIGISENKFLAKMASEMKKPLGITEIWQEDVKEKIWPLPVEKMYGVGRKTADRLNKLSIYTIGDIARCDIAVLRKAFGKYGEEMHRLANGIDLSPVSENPQHDSKSIGRSTTLPEDITDLEYAKKIILQLAEEVGAEARKYGYKGRTISITIKYSDFKTITRQKSVLPTYLTRDIYEAGAELLTRNWNLRRPVRLLGISLGNCENDYVEQLTIFNLPGSKSDSKMEGKPNKIDKEKEEKLEKTMDIIREKYGQDKVKRAKMLQD
ncbi:MAG TPA: DNA polymerase IV [Clostridiaceae bacterium]|nr:DNA polymerase IV [Clostridiaceae bacterium]